MKRKSVKKVDFTVREVISLRGWGAAKARGWTYASYRSARKRADKKKKKLG